MLGADESLLTSTKKRRKSAYDFVRCTQDQTCTLVRSYCQLRGTLIDLYHSDKQQLLSAVDKDIYAEEHRELRKLMKSWKGFGTNPTVKTMLTALQRRIWSIVSSPWFDSLCTCVGYGNETRVLRSLFHLDYGADLQKTCQVLREAKKFSQCPVYASRMCSNLLNSDESVLRHAKMYSQKLYDFCGVGCKVMSPLAEEATEQSDSVKTTEVGQPCTKEGITNFLQDFYNFCSSHNKVLVEIDTENIKSSVCIPLIEHARMLTNLSVFAHITHNTSPSWLNACASHPYIQTVSVDKVTSQAKNQADLSVMVHTVKEYKGEPGVGVFILSSDSDFVVLADNLDPSHLCVGYVDVLAAKRYLKKLRELGILAVELSEENAKALRVADSQTAQEYFLQTLNCVLPNLRECYDNICMSSCKPKFEDIRWVINPTGQITAEIR